MGSESHLRRGGPQNASREPLGALLEASGAEQKEVGNGSGPVWAPKGAKTGAKMAPQNAPSCLHEAKTVHEASGDRF